MKENKLRLKKYFKQKLSNQQVLVLAKIYISFKKIFWPVINFIRIQKLKTKNDLKFHLGCGEKELPGFINVDNRVTVAADITRDLNMFSFCNDSVKCVFSHAFFEHLYRYKRVDHLKNIYKSLKKEDGFICYIGLPYFKNIARYYLDETPGTVGSIFDLYNVYRYTHGDPEIALKDGWYLGQLHKSLFDEKEIEAILKEAGFYSFTIFSYVFPFDEHPLSVTCGFYATKKDNTQDELRKKTISFLSEFSDQYVVLNSIKFINKE